MSVWLKKSELHRSVTRYVITDVSINLIECF